MKYFAILFAAVFFTSCGSSEFMTKQEIEKAAHNVAAELNAGNDAYMAAVSEHFPAIHGCEAYYKVTGSVSYATAFNTSDINDIGKRIKKHAVAGSYWFAFTITEECSGRSRRIDGWIMPGSSLPYIIE